MIPPRTAPHRRDISRLLWGDVSPYVNFPHRRFRADTQGWNSQHFYLHETIQQLRPGIVVEIGVWKGGSVIHMAEAIRQSGIASTVIAIDTWLGSAEHWDTPEWREGLLFSHGYPMLYYTFLTNIVERSLQELVVPLPLDSQSAHQVLRTRQISPSMVHLDSGHDYLSVASDLHRWWDVLEPGGAFIVDDYDPTAAVWPEVKRAVDDFLKSTPHERFSAHPYKCRFFKPAAAARDYELISAE